MAQIIPVRVLADSRPVLASERRFAANRGHPPCQRRHQMPDDVTVPVTIPEWMAARLNVLIDPDQGLPDLAAVIGSLLDHVQQGVYRPGAWERPWLEQAFGDSWLDRLEPDPGSPFDRPRAPRLAGMPALSFWQAYGVPAAVLPVEDMIIAAGHADPRRFLAAASFVAREEWGCDLSSVVPPGGGYAAVRHVWMIHARESTAESPWLIWETITADDPGAFAATILIPRGYPAADESGRL